MQLQTEQVNRALSPMDAIEALKVNRSWELKVSIQSFLQGRVARELLEIYGEIARARVSMPG
jgi:hypothetical protein